MRPSRVPPYLRCVGLLALTAAVPACNWTTFDKDAGKTPVRSISAPDGFKSGDFGQLLLPLSNGQGKSAAFVATSINESNIVIVTLDASGSVGNALVPKTALDDLEDSEVTSVVEVPDTTPVRLVLGTPEVQNQTYGQTYTYVLSPALDGMANRIIVPTFPANESGLGRGLAVGNLAGSSTMPDYVVASDDHIAVSVDVANGAPANGTSTMTVTGNGCEVAYDLAQEPRYKTRRPLLLARLWDDPPGSTFQQLVTGSTHTGAPGQLFFFSVTGDGTNFNLNCLAALPAPAPGMKSQFGRSLAAGDFNADGISDLLVGAPGQEAFVFMGPFPPGGVPAPIAISDTTGFDFGFSVAALNVNGLPGDEALIGDPRATVDGQEKAGRVVAYAYDAATGTLKSWKTYADNSPQANANYGTTINALKFCTSISDGVPCAPADTAKVLMVGASNEVFVYYREGENIPLRMRDGKMVPDVRAP